MRRILLCLLPLCLLMGCGNATRNETGSDNLETTTEVVMDEEVEVETAENETMISETENSEIAFEDNLEEKQKDGESVMKLSITVNGTTFVASFEENTAVDALKEKLSEGELEISLSDYSGFEKVGALGFSLPVDNNQMTTEAGDIVLYNGNQIVIFYGSNSWSYTKLAVVEDLTSWKEALGNSDVEVVLSLTE
ncbi:MAG: cyclophilin-like fold protein [Eubacteriales bacterium]|nr:cyclophilin-like fold protein [Eubacteriales bacterium]